MVMGCILGKVRNLDKPVPNNGIYLMVRNVVPSAALTTRQESDKTESSKRMSSLVSSS